MEGLDDIGMDDNARYNIAWFMDPIVKYTAAFNTFTQIKSFRGKYIIKKNSLLN